MTIIIKLFVFVENVTDSSKQMWISSRHNRKVAIILALNIKVILVLFVHFFSYGEELLRVTTLNFNSHLCSFNRQNFVKFRNYFECLLLRRLLFVQLDFAFTHGLNYNAQRITSQVFAIYAHCNDYMGYFFSQVFQLSLSFQITNLKFSLVQNFHEYFFFGHFVSKNLLKILFAGNFTTCCIGKYFIDLDDFINIRFLFVAPVADFVSVACKFKLFTSFRKFDNCDICKKLLIHRCFDVHFYL